MNISIVLPTRRVQRIEYNDDDDVKWLSPSSIYMRGKGGQQRKVDLVHYKKTISTQVGSRGALSLQVTHVKLQGEDVHK